MKDIKKLSTKIIISMINAHSSYFGRKLTEAELIDCKMTINMLQLEINSRILIAPGLLLKRG